MTVQAKIGAPVRAVDRAHLPASPLIALLESGSPRFAWKRSARCPCVSINSETANPDPECPKCGGRGDFQFAPDVADSETVDRGALSAEQLAHLDGAACIRGSLSGGMRNETYVDQFGHWMSGRALITVRPENVIGYHDRLVCLDTEIALDEPVQVGTDFVTVGLTIPTRYPVTRAMRVESIDTVYVEDVDYEVADGVLRWRGAAPNTPRVSVSYLCRPVYIVEAFPHAIRVTQVFRGAASTTPLGTPEPLVLQTVVRLEFLID